MREPWKSTANNGKAHPGREFHRIFEVFSIVADIQKPETTDFTDNTDRKNQFARQPF
jgi:hypothetical protein